MYLSRIRLRPDIGATQLGHLLEDRKGYGLHRLFWGLFQDDKGKDKTRDFLFREEIAAEQYGRHSTLPQSGRKGDPVYYVLSDTPPNESPLFDVNTKHYQPQLKLGDRLAFKLRVNAVVSRKGRRQRKNGKPIVVRHDIVMDAQNSWLNSQLESIGQGIEGTKGNRKQRLLEYAGDRQLEQWRTEIETGVYRQKLEQQLGRSALMEWAIKTAEAERVYRWWERQGLERHGFDIAPHPESGSPLFEYAAYLNHPIPEKGKSAGFSSLDLTGEVLVTDVERFTRLLMEGTGPAKAFGCGLMLVRRV